MHPSREKVLVFRKNIREEQDFIGGNFTCIRLNSLSPSLFLFIVRRNTVENMIWAKSFVSDVTSQNCNAIISE
jgi:hypothetical protein